MNTNQTVPIDLFEMKSNSSLEHNRERENIDLNTHEENRNNGNEPVCCPEF